MVTEHILIIIILVVALVLFWKQWLRTDITAVIVMMALILPWPHPDGIWKGVISYQDGFSGFGSSAVIMVVAMFIFGGAIVKTGAAEVLGIKFFRANSGKEWRFQLTILVVATASSMFINDTTVVLIYLPMILSICKEKNISPSRYLLFLAYGSLLGGQWTLIGTRSNIIISDFFRQSTGNGLGFFNFTPIAAAIFILAAVYLILIGKKLLPTKRGRENKKSQKEYLTEVIVTEDSGVIGKSLRELEWSKRSNLSVVEIIRDEERMPDWIKLRQGDKMIIRGDIDTIGDLLKSSEIKLKEEVKIDPKKLQSVDLVTVEALISPNSNYAGRTLDVIDFSRYYGFTIIGVSRHGKTLKKGPSDIKLEYGDSLLLLGNVADVERLGRNKNLMLLEEESFPAIGKKKAAIVIILLLGIIITSITNVLPPPVSLPLAALLVIILGCIRVDDAYNTIDWRAVVTVAAMIPYGIALEKTHTAEEIAKFTVSNFENLGPFAVMGFIFIIAVVVTQFIDNAAVAIILAPIAYQLSVIMKVNPRPFMVGLAICISAAFCTPVGHESTILVNSPGNYEFKHYLMFGSGLAILTWFGATFLTPVIWPF
ncbi:MAG TPA: SLC13 family permease [Ignavibacteriaceae bacterium]|nr:SLC13 family permease [Ignavibacteriaceae bacterium]